MTIIGILMVLGFGFLTFRNFRSGRLFWALVSGFGMLLGFASLWVDYQRASDATVQHRAAAADPWAKDS